MPISPAAIGVVLDSTKTKVLLVKRQDVPIWVLPGGGIDPNETAEDAVIREIKEETGFDVQIKRKCAEYTPINQLAAFTTIFLCEILKGQAELSPETSDIQFYPLHNLPFSFFDVHREWLEEALSSKTLIRKPLKNITYFKAIKYFFQHPFYVIRYLLTRSRNS